MAIGAITVLKKADAFGEMNADLVSFAGDGAYPTGGTAIEAALRTALSKGTVDVFAVIPQDCGGYWPVWDEANNKLKVYYHDYDAVADGPGIEVPNTTNLSAVTFKLVVISK